MESHRFCKKSATIALNGTYSAGFQVPGWASFALVYFPAMDNGDIGMEISIDGGSNYAPFLKSDGSADAVLCASGAEPACIDISDYIRAVPPGEEGNTYLRFTCAQQSSGAVTPYVFFKA